MMQVAVRLAPIAFDNEPEFLAAVARSRKLHHPWVAPPATAEEFRALVARSHGPVNYAFVVRHGQADALAGFVNISNIVRGLFQSAYLGY
jgi:[ribosomal protein S5]-alanine N-acetyltransferase